MTQFVIETCKVIINALKKYTSKSFIFTYLLIKEFECADMEKLFGSINHLVTAHLKVYRVFKILTSRLRMLLN